MDLPLRERFARLGPTWGIDRVTCGSPVAIVLSLAPEREWPRTIDAMISLARRGVSMLTAKRAVEAVLEHGRTIIELPLVESEQVLLAELAKAGFDAVPQAADHAKLAPEPSLTRKSA